MWQIELHTLRYRLDNLLADWSLRGTSCWRLCLLRSATPQERRGERLTIIVREAPPLEEAHAARAGRPFLAAGAAINQ